MKEDQTMAPKHLEFEMRFTGEDVFIVVQGVKIAKRRDATWVSLEPGWRVLDGPNLDSISIECSDEVAVH